jgi:hypothetical protein
MPNGKAEECEMIRVGLNRVGAIFKQGFGRIAMTLKGWFDPRMLRTEADFHGFTARLYSCWGLAYGLFHVWFGSLGWDTVWRIPALGISVQGTLNAVLFSGMFRIGKRDLRRHIEWWRFIASANLLLGLFSLAWLGTLGPRSALDASLARLVGLQVVNYGVTFAAHRLLQQFALRLPETSKE